jgi:hypothetical protein
MPALALSLGGLFCIVRRPESRRALLACGLLLTAAVFTRQTYALAAPFAACVWLGARSGRRAAALAGIVGGLSFFAFLAIHTASGGGFFFHVVTANVNEFRLERLARLAGELGLMLPAFVAAGVAFAVARGEAGRGTRRLVLPYLAAAAIAALTIGKTGSNVNYWLELCAALSLATGALFAQAAARPMLQTGIALLLLVQTSFLLGGTRYHEHLRWKLDQRARLAALSEVVRGADGPVLADEELGLLPLESRPVELQPFEMTQLARSGSWDEAPLLSSLERGQFEMILMYRVPWSPVHRTRWTPSMLDRIDRAYVPVAEIGPTVVYRPRGLAGTDLPARLGRP